MQAWCIETGRQFTRFDYFGHGASSGRVEKGRIGRWAVDTLAVLDEVTRGLQVIVGSSMRPEDLRRLVRTAEELLATVDSDPAGGKTRADDEHAGSYD